MKKRKKLEGAEALGVKVIISKKLDKLPRKVLFPKELEKANRILAELKRSGQLDDLEM